MNTRDSNIDALEQLRARAAVTDLLHRYARAVRNGDAAGCAALFTEDAVFEIRESAPDEAGGYRLRQVLNGQAAIRAYLQQGSAATVRVIPLIHSSIVEVNGMEAVSNSMMTAWVLPAGRQLLGEYQDRYRYDNGWRFAGRVYTILGRSGSPAV